MELLGRNPRDGSATLGMLTRWIAELTTFPNLEFRTSGESLEIDGDWNRLEVKISWVFTHC